MSDDDDKVYEQVDSSSSSGEEQKCTCSDNRRGCSLHRRLYAHQSKIWDYFIKKSKYKGQCRLCEKSLSCRSTITNLKLHLKRKHPVSFATMTGEIVFNNTDDKFDGEDTEQVLFLQDESGKVEEFLVESSNLNEHNAIWRWYKRIGWKKAKCHICHLVLTFNGGEDLRHHIVKKHPDHVEKLENLEGKLSQIVDGATDEKQLEINMEVQSVNYEDIKKRGGKQSTELPSCSCGAEEEGTMAPHKSDCVTTMPSSWDFYDNITLNTAQCRICDRVISWRINVNDLRRHLLEQHPDVTMKDQDVASEQPNCKPEILVEEMYLDEDMLREEDRLMQASANKRKKKRKFAEEEVVAKPTKANEDWDKSLDRFGLYIASLMKMLPRATAAKFQMQIIERLMKEKMKNDLA